MIPACRLADLPRGEAFRLDIDPPVSVFHTDDGEVFAIDDTCTHQDASLADGWLEGCEVECPLHASKFDLRTGAVDSPPAKLPVRTHEVVDRGRHGLRTGVHATPPTCRPASRPGSPGVPREDSGRGGRLAGRTVGGALPARRRATTGGWSSSATSRTARTTGRRCPRSSWPATLGEADLALETDGEDLRAEWLLGARAAGLDPRRPRRPPRRRPGRPRRRHRHRDRRRRAHPAGHRRPRRRAHPAHPRRRPRPARRTGPRWTAGGDRRRVHRRRGRLHRVRPRPRRDGRRGRADTAAPDRSARPWARVVSGLHADHGVRLLCGVGVKGLSGRADGRRPSLLDDGRSVPADIVVVGVGARPCVEWLAGSGVDLDNGVKCGADGRTSLAGVVAVGDCANWYDPRVGAHRRVEHWTGARERPAAAVATLLAGGAVEPGGAPAAVLLVRPVRGEDPVRRASRRGADSVTVEEGRRRP